MLESDRKGLTGEKKMIETRLLTLGEAARLLGMSPAGLRAMSERGNGPIPSKIAYNRGRPSKDGLHYAYSLAEIERWVSTKADPETAVSYWLGRLWASMRTLDAAEVSALLDTISAMLPEMRAVPNVADVMANVGMVLTADSRARNLDLDDAEAAPEPRCPRIA